LYKCHPWSSSSSITVGLFASPHKLKRAFSEELLSLVSDNFLPSPASTSPTTYNFPGCKRATRALLA
ncbi:hypothetical protein EE88_21265, partial [Salmonella enterica]|nr:hypothetical protein [Salmonella enterica]